MNMILANHRSIPRVDAQISERMIMSEVMQAWIVVQFDLALQT